MLLKRLAAASLALAAAGAAAAPKRNVLYIVFDDLRPDLSPYQDGREAQMPMHTPHIQKLADTGVVFDRAYVQIAVCSPSRMSFSTGRRPNGTRAWNFINHFREARCANTNNERVAEGTAIPGGFNSTGHGWGYTRTGGYAQCCTSCSALPECKGWSYENGACALYSAVRATEPCTGGRGPSVESFDTCISGTSGGYPQWTPLPANFKKNDYLVMGVGKYYHAGCGSLGGAKGDADHPAGVGHPPLADRALSWSAAGHGWNGSWSANASIQFPDQEVYWKKWGRVGSSFGPGQYLNPDDEACGHAGGESSDYCTTPWGADGDPVPDGGPPAAGTTPLADFITYQDAIVKMRFAKENLATNNQPFFLVTGIKRPHLNWRSPAGYVDYYPLENVSVPEQLTLDESIDPVAWAAFPMNAPLGPNGSSSFAARVSAAGSPNFMKTPYVHGSDYQLRKLRQHYYATVSWADYACGQILRELDALKLTESTMVVLHSDHGWHLGEFAEWEKRTNWELGVRIPLIMRVPWMPSASSGKHARGLVEAVDIYQTVCDIMGVPLPEDEAVAFEGTSLRPILEDPEQGSVKAVALSTFPRCSHIGMPSYGNRGSPGGQDNTCLDVERTSFTWMGYTMRTDRYRYTEYVVWNGTTLSPVWGQLKAAELYDHEGDDGPWTDPDRFENVNLAKTASPALVKQLSAQMHAAFGFPDIQ